ncbi:MAG: hypothetical protein K1X75_17795 [Leptospirales bacterium]|nr:hypothetical protein [Leptospirales bacterium]
MSNQPQATGLVDPSKIRPRPPQIDANLIGRLKKLQDLSASIADVLDNFGVDGAVGASILRPTMAGKTIIGTAITVRKTPAREAPATLLKEGRSDLGEIEGANQLRAGDILVIEGQANVSAMGGIMSTICKRQGGIGAVVDGGVRDIEHSIHIDFPIWSSHVTPITGKWRSVVEEINGPVSIAGCKVFAGDLVVADGTGVVFIPQQLAEKVIEQIEAISQKEDAFRDALMSSSTASLTDLLRAVQQAQSAKSK